MIGWWGKWRADGRRRKATEARRAAARAAWLDEHGPLPKFWSQDGRLMSYRYHYAEDFHDETGEPVDGCSVSEVVGYVIRVPASFMVDGAMSIAGWWCIHKGGLMFGRCTATTAAADCNGI